MKIVLPILLFALLVTSCTKDSRSGSVNCNMIEVYAANEAKVTVSNGIWGTVSFLEGNCMPIVGPGSGCKECPVKRAVRIYQYTTSAQATPWGTSTVFFHSFSTQLVKEVIPDSEGFFQTELPPGQYTMVVVEDGKLYASGRDGQGGINSFTHQGGQKKINFRITYKAVF